MTDHFEPQYQAVPTGEIRHIHRDAIPVWQMGNLLWLPLYLAPIYMVVFRWSRWESPLLILGLALLLVTIFLLITTWWLPKLRWSRWRYQLGEHHIMLRHGLFIVKETIIPFARVQLVDTKQGPIMRSYQLSDVSIATAGGNHSIPALHEDEATWLRNHIAEQARLHDVDV